MKILRLAFPLAILIALLSSGCKKDALNGNGALSFSTDTVIFDTVFTTIGSVTRQFKIYNPSSSEVTISSIMLAGGQQSKYRMNLDGVPGVAFSNITIPGKDSLFVFVDVTLDPNNLSEPAIVTDSVVFNTNGTIQDVDLVAFGWDADFTYPNVFDNPIGPYRFLNCDITWTSAVPHVIYGWAVVPDGCTLTIEAGSRIYSHKGSGIIVDEGGTLIVNGTPQNQVVFASDRLDDFYEDQAGEWNRIWLYNGSKNNVINGAVIKNGNVGIEVDTISPGSSNPTLTISNTIIENMAGASLVSYSGTIDAYNCVFGNAGQYSVALLNGGVHNFYHCTIGNYWVNGNRQTPSLLLTNWIEIGDIIYRVDLASYFGNCIIYGNNQTELGLDKDAFAAFNIEFDNCLLKVDFNAEEPIDISSVSEFHEMIYNQDPKFVDPVDQNFELDTLSAAINVGKESITNDALLSQDVAGNLRIVGPKPDLGAYERQQ
ncbi:MAG: right-handed parallel beta-helix repeat-containing protein [Flavobacteriales bacterium]|nr:right-handed parallel beta-helix repeat-containing protein [Flavobacteriales bacterium]